MKFAPPSLFSAFAVAATGDADLPDGIHLRLCLSPDLGPPLCPFAIWRTTLGPTSVVPGIGVLALPADATTDARRVVAIVTADTTAAPRTLVIAEPVGGAEIARRSAVPWQIAAPVIQSARIDGAPAGTRAGVFTVQAQDFAKFITNRPDALLSLPIAGPCLWYAGDGSPAAGLDRVKRGAPRRFTPVDRPAGPFDALSPAAEVTRVRSATEIDPKLEQLLRQDDKTPPARRTFKAVDPVLPGQPNPPAAEIGLWDALILQTTDLGYARYAGLATTFDSRVGGSAAAPTIERTRIEGFWVAGLFATTPEGATASLTGLLGGDPFKWARHVFLSDPDEQQIIKGFRAVTPGLGPVLDRAAAAGLQVRAMLTFCAAPVPADPPRAGNPAADMTAWIGHNTAPSTTFRTRFTFAGQSLGAVTLSMAASFGGAALQPRTSEVSGSGGRRRPLLAGRNDQAVVTASDTGIPAAPLPIVYRFQAADLWARYGSASACTVAPPKAPAPPAPVPQTSVTRGPVPAGDGPASPGTLRVVVPVPDFAALAPGARPIAKLAWTLANTLDPAQPTLGGSLAAPPPAPAAQIAYDVPLPGLSPMATGEWTLTVTFVDDAGTPSPPATRLVTATDGRAPKVVTAGPGIVWTSRPGPAPEVELNLRWPAAPGQLYRAYLASAASLELPGATRAAIGLAGSNAKLSDRTPFQLLSDPPIAAGSDGWARLSTTLPRALRDVGMVKIVAVSPQGVEADFGASGAVPVAVPTDLPPPPPRVSVATNPDGSLAVRPDGTGVTLSVAATGLDLVALQAAEPGLFAAPAAPGAKPPLVRLRRATGAVNDPLYARAIGGATALERQADGSFAVRIDQSGLTPFVRYSWWADVRMPDERRLPPGAVATGGGIQAEPGTPADMPGLPSRLSMPFSTVPAPVAPPAPLPASALTATIVAQQPSGVTTRIASVTVSGLPVAPAGAIGAWRVRIWWRWGDKPIQQVADAPTTGPTFGWSSGAYFIYEPITFWASLVDPLGRESAMTQVTVTP